MKINWKLIVVLFLATVALGVTGIGLRNYHRSKRVQTGLTRGLSAYEDGQWNEAAIYLGQYLSIHQQDVDILVKYARSQLRFKPFKRENLAQAVNAYRVVLRNQDHPQAGAEIIEIYLRFGMPVEAELIARRFIEKDETGRFRQMLARSLILQRKFEEAVDVLLKLVGQKPDQVLAYKLLGEIAEKRPELNEIPVQQWFNKAIEKNPASAQAYILRSAYLARQGHVKEAFKDIERAEKCDLSEVGVRLSLAVSWINLMQLKKARQYLEDVEARNPSSEDLWQIWAIYAVKAMNHEEMIRVAEKGLASMGADNFSFLPIAAELYIQAGDFSRAEECLLKLRAAQADPGVILYLEGLIAMANMNWADAAQKWQKAIHLGYSSETAYLNLAKVYEQIGNRSLAIQTLRRYGNQNEESSEVRFQLAKLYMNEGQLKQASDQLLAAIQLEPAKAELHTLYLTCRIEMTTQNQEVEIAVLKQAIQDQINTNDSIANRMLFFRLSLKLENFVLAEKILDQAEERFGENEQLALNRGELFWIEGRKDEAISYMEEAVQAYPESDEIKQWLVWGYAKTNQPEKSREVILDTSGKTSSAFKRRTYSLWLAELALFEGKEDEALHIYKALSHENKSDIFVRRKLLALQFNQADRTELQQWVDDIAKVEGDNGWQWKYEQARLWFNEKDFSSRYTQIVELLNANLALNPDDQASRILLASCHERAGNMQLAIALYRDALLGQPDNIDLIVGAVRIMHEAGEFSQVRKLLGNTADKNIWDPRLSKYELENNLRLGCDDNVTAVLEKIVVIAPEDADARLSLALSEICKGNFLEARKEIEMLLADHPDSIAATAALADLYLNEKQPQKALDLCDAFVADHDTIQAHIMRSQVLLMMGKTADVLESLEAIETKYGADTKTLLFLSKQYQKIGQMEKSLKILDHLLSTESGNDFNVQKEAALLFLTQKSMPLYQKGMQCLQAALEQNPNDLQLRMKKALMLIQEKNAIAFSEAKIILNRIVNGFPVFESAWAALAQISLQEDNLGQSMDYLLQGLSYVPESKILLQMKARVEGMRSPKLAISTLEQLHSQYPEDTEILVMLSRNYRKGGNGEKALDLLSKNMSWKTAEKEIELQIEWMLALWETGEKESASQFYEKFIRDTNDPSVLMNWIELHTNEIRALYQEWTAVHPESTEEVLMPVLERLMQTGHPDAFRISKEMLNSYLKQKPDSAIAHYAMALLLHRKGMKQEAIPWYEKTLQLDRKQVIAMNNLAWILCTEKKEYPKSMQLANEGLEIAPAYVDLIDTRGLIYMNLGNYEKAVEDFDQCSKMYFEADPRQTISTFLLGKCLFLSNKKEQSLVELLKAREQNSQKGGLTEEQVRNLEELLKKL